MFWRRGPTSPLLGIHYPVANLRRECNYRPYCSGRFFFVKKQDMRCMNLHFGNKLSWVDRWADKFALAKVDCWPLAEGLTECRFI